MGKRLHVFFSGTVQGVGFRFAAEKMAKRFPVTGFVRNLPTGKVEVVAEGEEKSLLEFLKILRENWHSYLHDVDVHWGSATGEYQDFGIRF